MYFKKSVLKVFKSFLVPTEQTDEQTESKVIPCGVSSSTTIETKIFYYYYSWCSSPSKREKRDLYTGLIAAYLPTAKKSPVGPKHVLVTIYGWDLTVRVFRGRLLSFC